MLQHSKIHLTNMAELDNLISRAKSIRSAYIPGSVTNEEVGLLLLDIINYVKNNSGGGGSGTPDKNYWSKEEIQFMDQYLLVLEDKIKAGFADNSKLWDGALFTDYIDQTLRTTDDVKFKSLLTDLIETITITTETLQTPDFVSGFLGSGTRLKDNHLELDEITVRKRMTVRELMIEKIKSVGGTLILSVGACKIAEVTDGGTYFKCSFDNDGGNIENPFVEDDQILCQTFSGNSIKRYWRRVTSTGPDYFNLSKSDCEENSANPECGDECVQLGHRSDVSRQNAMILCAVGPDAPYIDQYSGINSFSLAGKLVSREGNLSGLVDETLGQLEGSGLYSKNVYLRGKLALSSGKEVETVINETSAKADNAQSTAESAQQQANTANAGLTKVTQDVQLLTDAQNGFNLKVSTVEEKIDGLQIGGVNLLDNTDRIYPTNGKEYTGIQIPTSIFKVGETYTWSFDLKIEGNFPPPFTKVYNQDYGGVSLQFMVYIGATQEWRRYSVTFTWKEPIDYLNDIIEMSFYCNYGSGSFPRLRHPQLEAGNKATAWSPSLADQKTKTTELQAQITANRGQIELRATKNEFDALGNRVGTAEGRITTLSDQISLSVTKDNIISKINLSPEAIRISSAKIEITGQTIFRDANNNVVQIFGTGNDVFNINNAFRVDKFGKATMTGAKITGLLQTAESDNNRFMLDPATSTFKGIDSLNQILFNLGFANVNGVGSSSLTMYAQSPGISGVSILHLTPTSIILTDRGSDKCNITTTSISFDAYKFYLTNLPFINSSHHLVVHETTRQVGWNW